jgi:hypothetical protein
MSDSAALQRFRKSMGISYEQWHDGVGYDLDAFAAMTPEERDAIAAEICTRRNLDWRDMEVLRIHNGRESFDRLRDALAAGGIEERAYAVAELIKTGRMAGAVRDVQLAHVLDDLTDIRGLTVALQTTQEHGGPMCNGALLRGVRDRPAVAYHFAGVALYLAGVSDSPWGADFRELLLRLRVEESPGTHVAAFAEFCRVIGIDPASIPPQGHGRGIEFPKGRRRSTHL